MNITRMMIKGEPGKGKCIFIQKEESKDRGVYQILILKEVFLRLKILNLPYHIYKKKLENFFLKLEILPILYIQK